MNKRNVRSFSIGILLSVFLIGFFYFFQSEAKQDEYSLEDAKTLLEGKGYRILKEAEYNALQEKATIPNETKPQEQEKEQVEVKEPNKNTEEDVQDEPPADPIINYQLEIVSGMTSNEIATILAQNQIVKDEAAFARFLIKHHYHTALQLGSFPVTNQMSFEQIANMITKN